VRRSAPCLSLLVAAGLAACSGSRDDSLRSGLDRLPQDTGRAAAQPESIPVAPPAPEAPSALPDTAGLPYTPPGAEAAPNPVPGLEQPPVNPQDSVRPTPVPGPPNDTRPSIPVHGPKLPRPDEWTSGSRTADRGGEPSLATAVRVGRNPDFDRVVFEFGTGAAPGYHVEYVDRPVRQCGSGHAVDVEGDAWLEIRLTPARAHDSAGNPTVMHQSSLHPEMPVVREIRLTCDFEGHVTWVLGLAHPNRYRVITLRNPSRIVVDVRR
jgi:hypothetical protein